MRMRNYYHFGIKKSPASSISYNRSDIKSMKPDSPNMFRFDITNNGKPLSLEEQNALGLTLKIDDISFTPDTDAKFYLNFGKTKVKCKLVQNEDGSYSLIPSCPFAIPALLLQAGKYNIRVSISPDGNITEKVTFDVTVMKNRTIPVENTVYVYQKDPENPEEEPEPQKDTVRTPVFVASKESSQDTYGLKKTSDGYVVDYVVTVTNTGDPGKNDVSGRG